MLPIKYVECKTKQKELHRWAVPYQILKALPFDKNRAARAFSGFGLESLQRLQTLSLSSRQFINPTT